MLYPHNTKIQSRLLQSMEKAYLPKRRIKSLVMISGGLDSVALLANLLAHTDHEVHAHHIEIRNKENRWEIENRTLDRVLPYFKEHYRPFTYTTSKYELMLGLGGGLDMTLATFTAARVHNATGGHFDLVFTGHVAARTWEYNEASAVFTACFTANRSKPVWLIPLSRQSKFDIYNSIPPELAALTWSCRTPIEIGSDYQPCEKCHACKTRAELAAEVEKFKTKSGAA